MKIELKKLILLLLILFGENINSFCGSIDDPDKNKDKYNSDSLLKVASNFQDSGNFPKALEILNEALQGYVNDKNFKGSADSYSLIGITYYLKGDYSNALLNFDKSVLDYKKVKYKKGISSVLNNIGGVYYFLGNYVKSLEYYKQSMYVQEELGNAKVLAATTLNIGGIYSKMEDYPNALKYHNKSLSIAEKSNDIIGIAQALNSIGVDYTNLGNFEKSFEFLNRALKEAQNKKDIQLETVIYSSLGELFYKKLDLKKSLFYFDSCIKNAGKINNNQLINISQVAIGNIKYKLKNYAEAIDNCSEGLFLARKLNALDQQKEACDCLYKSYKSLGKTQLALSYFEKANSLKDSLKIEETSNKMMNMEFQKQQLVDSLAFVKKQHIAEQKHKEEVQRKEKQRNYIIATLCLMVLVAVGLWSSLSFVRKSRTALKIEKDRSEELLLNILPYEIAEELKEKGSVNTQEHNLVSILFTDFKAFTQTAANMTPQRLVEEINVCFKAFDLIVEKYQIEKIKTIGDAYMAASGLPHPFDDSFKNMILAGIEMQEFITERSTENKQKNLPAFEMRLGIHTGPIVAGVVGVKKFQYDVWGDTVNTASRMESNCEVGRVNISETLYNLVKDYPEFEFEYRGEITAKGKGEIKMYFVGKKS